MTQIWNVALEYVHDVLVPRIHEAKLDALSMIVTD